MRRRVQRWACKVGAHRWRYFIDGTVCRVCSECRHVEYDLPWASHVDMSDKDRP